jgi:hypothetical protein
MYCFHWSSFPYCFHWSSFPLGQPSGVGSWPPGPYLWNEWDSHPIFAGHQKMYCFHWSSFPLGQPRGVGSWSPGSYLWNEWDSHSDIFTWMFPLVSLVPLVNLLISLKWVIFPPCKYIFDGHQDMYHFHLSVLSPVSTLWCGVMPGSYLWNEWHSHSINIYLMVIKWCRLVPWVNVVVWGYGPLGPTSEMSQPYGVGSWPLGPYLWNEWHSHPWVLPLKWVRFPLYAAMYIYLMVIKRWIVSTGQSCPLVKTYGVVP